MKNMFGLLFLVSGLVASSSALADSEITMKDVFSDGEKAISLSASEMQKTEGAASYSQILSWQQSNASAVANAGFLAIATSLATSTNVATAITTPVSINIPVNIGRR